MTGPDHYREAERWARIAKEWFEMDDADGTAVASQAAAGLAQVHATLALAAATATLDSAEGPGGGSATGRTTEDAKGWEAVLGGDGH